MCEHPPEVEVPWAGCCTVQYWYIATWVRPSGAGGCRAAPPHSPLPYPMRVANARHPEDGEDSLMSPSTPSSCSAMAFGRVEGARPGMWGVVREPCGGGSSDRSGCGRALDWNHHPVRNVRTWIGCACFSARLIHGRDASDAVQTDSLRNDPHTTAMQETLRT